MQLKMKVVASIVSMRASVANKVWFFSFLEKSRHMKPFTITLVVFILVFSSSLDGMSQSTQKIPQHQAYSKKANSFWKWFKKNQYEIEQEIIVYNKSMLLVRQLNNYHRGLSAVFDFHQEKFHLAISAGGDLRLIPFVELLLEKKPKIKMWTTHAFMQAKEQLADSLVYLSNVIYAKDIRVNYRQYDSVYYISVELNKYLINELDHAIVLSYLQDVFGEYYLMKNIIFKGINVHDKSKYDSLPLPEFHRMWKKKHPTLIQVK